MSEAGRLLFVFSVQSHEAMESEVQVEFCIQM
jgi:hypothetical protein